MTKPIGYWSRSLASPELVYDTTQRDCHAILWEMLLLRPYFKRTRPTIRTNYDSLNYILNLSDASEKRAPWHLQLASFAFNVVYRASVKHQVADLLSRVRTDGKMTTPLDDDLLKCNLEKIQVKNDDWRYVHVCTECDVDCDLRTGAPVKRSTEKKKPRVNIVNPRNYKPQKSECHRSKRLPLNRRNICIFEVVRHKLE